MAALRVSFSLSKAIFFSNVLSRSVCRDSPSLKRQNCTVQQAVSSMAVCVVPVRICSVVCTIPKTEGVSEACSALSQALRVGAELLYSSRELPEAGFCYDFGVFSLVLLAPFFLNFIIRTTSISNLQQLRNFTTVQVFLPYQFEDSFQFLVSLAPR